MDNNEFESEIAKQLKSYASAAESAVGSSNVTNINSAAKSKRLWMVPAAAACVAVAMIGSYFVLKDDSIDLSVGNQASQPPSSQPSTLGEGSCPGFPGNLENMTLDLPFTADSITYESAASDLTPTATFSSADDAAVFTLQLIPDGLPSLRSNGQGAERSVSLCNPYSLSTDPEIHQTLVTNFGDNGVAVSIEFGDGQVLIAAIKNGNDLDRTTNHLLDALRSLTWTESDQSAPDTTIEFGNEPSQATTVPKTNNSDSATLSFYGIGDYKIGDVSETAQSEFDNACGNWREDEFADFDEPGIYGLATLESDGVWYISDVRTDDPNVVTASGIHVGVDLETLQRVYGGGLTIDRADGWENPTDDLLASYQDVAAVTYDDRAITFILRDDVVERIKVSDAEFWGDDEGCA